MLASNKISLGTAKLGMPEYGISDGVTQLHPVDFILRSLDRGLKHIDTSPRYGNSEELIGRALEISKKKPSVSTKIDNLVPKSTNTPNVMIRSIHESISKLKTCVDVCYLHQNDMQIISDKYVHEGIRILKSNNVVKEMGTSVYTHQELLYSLECGIYDWVQIPLNILDTSFYRIASNHVSDLKIAARSVFLQGIIFSDQRAQIKIENYDALLTILRKIRDLASDSGITIQQLSLAYLSSLKGIDQIIVGTISDDKFIENMQSVQIQLNQTVINFINKISYEAKLWTNPRVWKL